MLDAKSFSKEGLYFMGYSTYIVPGPQLGTLTCGGLDNPATTATKNTTPSLKNSTPPTTMPNARKSPTRCSKSSGMTLPGYSYGVCLCSWAPATACMGSPSRAVCGCLGKCHCNKIP
ncbi:MAG: hypothetical protein MZU97_08255 [Bacillus subtilis]|nr:hypothetical protein [Bacillus subtilis]